MNTTPKLNSIELAKRKKVLLRKFALIQRMTADTSGSFSISGTGAYTSGKHVNLPVGDFSDPEYLDMIEGMLDHENGHCKHTNFNNWNGIKTDLVRTLTNIFEDIRIETKVGLEYPGAKINLEKLVKIAIHRKMFSMPVETDSLITLVQKFLLYKGRNQIIGQTSLKSYSDAVIPLLKNVLPDSFQDLSDVLADAANSKSTADAIVCAERVVAILKQEQQEQEQQEQEQDDSSSSDSNDSSSDPDDSSSDSNDSSSDPDDSSSNSDDSSSDSNSSSNSDDSSSDSNSSSDPDDSSSDSNSSSDQQNSSSDSSHSDSDQLPSNSQQPSKQATAQDIIDALNAGNDDLMGDLHEEIEKLLGEKAEQKEKEYQTENGRYATPTFALHASKNKNFSGMPAWISEAAPVTQKMRQVLNSVVYARNKTERSFDRTGNTIAAGELWGTSCGNSRIFQVETTHRAPNAAFQILVDKSGSMDGEAMKLANIAAYSIASAIEFIRGAECEVLYYPTYGRTGLEVHVAKSFKEKMPACRSNSFDVRADYGTPTAEALLTALSRIGTRKEPKKVIFLITDGDACNCNIYDVLKDCDAANVDVIGVGIGLQELAGFEDRPYVSIADASELAPQLFTYVRNFYQK